MMSSDEDREKWRFLTMKNGEDSMAGPPQRTCFESSPEHSQCMFGDTEKEKATKSMYNRSQEGKKRTR